MSDGSHHHEECPICFETSRTMLTLMPCAHRFCAVCLPRLMQKKTVCPMCRRVPLACSESFDDDEDNGNLLVCCMLEPALKAGITLTNEYSTGVRITRLIPHDAAHQAGLHVNDVLTYINHIPCRDHRDVVSMWNDGAKMAKETNSTFVMLCRVQRRMTTYHRVVCMMHTLRTRSARRLLVARRRNNVPHRQENAESYDQVPDPIV